MATTVRLPDGRTVNFPDGMPLEQVTAEVAKLSPAEPQQPTQKTWGEAAAEALPTLGGIVGGFVGKVPGIRTLSAGIGGAAGEGYKQLAQHVGEIPGAMRDIATTGAQNPTATLGGFAHGAAEGAGQAMKQGAIQSTAQAGGELVGAGLRSLGSKFSTAATSAYERMLKANKSTLEGMNKFGPDLQSRSRNVAKQLLRDPNGQITKTGASRFADATHAIQGKVDEIVDANPEARGSTQHLADALEAGKGKFLKQWAPQGDMAAYTHEAGNVLKNPRILKSQRRVVTRTTGDELGRFGESTGTEVVGKAMIPRVRANTARELTQGTYRTLGDKAYGELKGAATEAQKAAARGGRMILNEALPQVKPLNDVISKRIDLGQVLDEAVFRSGKHDPVGLGQQVILSGGHLGWIPASLLNRPGVGSHVARGLDKAGIGLAKSSGQDMTAAALKAAIFDSIFNRDRETSQR